MGPMVPLLVAASLTLAAIQVDAPQASSVLHVRVAVVDADQRPVPLPRHALLVSDNPPTSAPRRIVTTPDGTAQIRLRPGTYIVESDRPTALGDRAYQWTQIVEIVAGRETTLELTAANAEIGPVTAEIGAAQPPADALPAPPAPTSWRDGGVTVWTEFRQAAGAVVSSKGLVATPKSTIGDATSVEVQLSPTDKVAGRVVASDSAEDVALVQVHPSAVSGVPLSTLDCGSTDAAVCALVASAEQRNVDAPPPGAARLPVEPSKPLPLADLKAAAAARRFSLSPYSISSSDFDIVFITPVLLAGAESQRGRSGGPIGEGLSGMRAVTEFGEWSAYVAASPPVLFIRAAPKLVESFWMKFARGAAMTQGAAIPPIKRVGPGFSRMRVLCGNLEVPPVHPFRIRSAISDTEVVDEGFYVFDPMAIGPHCGTVSLVLASVKEPDKTETRPVNPSVIAQVWEDFAVYREK